VQLLDTVITGLFRAALSLHTAADLPADAVRQRIDAALGDLDDIIREVRNAAFTSRDHRGLPRPAPSGDDDNVSAVSRRACTGIQRRLDITESSRSPGAHCRALAIRWPC
jgi:hypothetical protein